MAISGRAGISNPLLRSRRDTRLAHSSVDPGVVVACEILRRMSGWLQGEYLCAGFVGARLTASRLHRCAVEVHIASPSFLTASARAAGSQSGRSRP